MWTTDSLWFEIAVVSIIFAIGNMAMGQFEERTPKIRRVGKYLLILLLICGISVLCGRTVAMIVLSMSLLPVLYIHGIICQRKKVSMVGPVNRRANTMSFGSGTKTYFRKA